MKRITVGVEPPGEFERHRRLFCALECLFPVSFTAKTQDVSSPSDALIVFGASRGSVIAAARGGMNCYGVLSPASPGLVSSGDPVSFQNCRALAACLRGQTLADPESGGFVPVTCEPGEEVIAAKAGQPFWLHRPAADGSGGVDFVSLAPPVLSEKAYLAEFLNGDRFLRLLPLLNFLKRITENHGWTAAPRRACIVIDDPCLRWTSYGCINFQDLAAHGRTWNYHVAIATVPLAGDRVSAQNAALFRECSAHVSLVIHGNEHTWLELARPYSDGERTAILAQALLRITDMERRHGVEVCRVMEAPYGVIGRGMLEPLVALGYEAALITPSQFLRGNREAAFPATIGLHATECLSEGLCLLPRIKMAPRWKAEVLLAELLGQPIVIAGHHYDAADGMALLKDVANTINSLGSVRWTNLTEIARSQYQTRSEVQTLVVRLGSRRLFLPVGQDTQRITIERPWLINGAEEPLILRFPGGSAAEMHVLGGPVETVVSAGPSAIEIISPATNAVNPADVPERRRRLWPFVRSALMETRDRVYPYLRRSSRVSASVRAMVRRQGS